MGKKNKLPKPTLAESKSAFAFGVVFLLMCVGGVYAVYHVSSSHSVRPDLNQVPVYFKRILLSSKSPVSAKLIPSPKDIPDVLAQQPCYCYCQRQGHRSLLDCFASLHSTSCNICINEARLAGQLHRQGKTPEEIRTAIIQKQWTNLGSSK